MKNVMICLFASAGFDKAAQGLAGAGQRLAEELGGQLRAVVVGAGAEAVGTEVAGLADSVMVVDQGDLAEYQPETCLNALVKLAKDAAPRAILFSNDTYSQEIAPRLAHRLDASAVGDGVAVQAAGGAVKVTRQVYGGKAQAVIELKRYPAIVWLRSRSFASAAPRAAACKIARAALDVKADTRIRIVERRREDTGKVRLEDARVIVGGGRGIGGPEPFLRELQPLAELLGAQMAATRVACDAGWVPVSWQVGQTGKKVAPELYLAIAISGSSQHLAGISEAKNIAAINIDPEADIFKYCRFGIVADFRKVVPLLRKKVGVLSK